MLELRLDAPRIGGMSGDDLRRRLDPASGPMRDGLVQAGAIYLGSMRERYVRAARGDGTWKPLAPSTIARRRKGKRKGGTVEILRDTGLQLNSLSIGGPYNIAAPIQGGMAFGTAVFYAKHHQEPKVPGRPPQRTILVQPDGPTRSAMQKVLQDAANRAIASK